MKFRVLIEQDEDGQFVAELHLDYGLKGKWADVYCPVDGTGDVTAYDRYLPVNPGLYGDFDAVGLNVSDDLASGCDIPSCQDYLFWHEATARGLESVVSGGGPHTPEGTTDELNARVVEQHAGEPDEPGARRTARPRARSRRPWRPRSGR